jgi:hypothetical protein
MQEIMMGISDLFSGKTTIDDLKKEHLEKFGYELTPSRTPLKIPAGLDLGEYRLFLYRCPDVTVYRGGWAGLRQPKFWKARY